MSWTVVSTIRRLYNPPPGYVSALGTVNRAGNSGTNPAVLRGVTASQVCSTVGVYEDPLHGALLVPASDINFSGNTSRGANASVFANPDAGSLGDHGLFKGCSGPNLHQIDMNFVKKTKITERVMFELRAEMFNIFNHPNFSPPAAPNINSAGFGTLTSNFTSREIPFNGAIRF